MHKNTLKGGQVLDTKVILFRWPAITSTRYFGVGGFSSFHRHAALCFRRTMMHSQNGWLDRAQSKVACWMKTIPLTSSDPFLIKGKVIGHFQSGSWESHQKIRIESTSAKYITNSS